MLAAQLDKILVQAKDGCLDADPPLSKLSSEQRKQQLAKSNRVKIIKYFFVEMGRVIKRPQEAAKYKLGKKVQELWKSSSSAQFQQQQQLLFRRDYDEFAVNRICCEQVVAPATVNVVHRAWCTKASPGGKCARCPQPRKPPGSRGRRGARPLLHTPEAAARFPRKAALRW